MGEYEKTISQMLTKRDEEKKEFEATVKKAEAERDSTVQHLNNLENAFNDIHQLVQLFLSIIIYSFPNFFFLLQ